MNHYLGITIGPIYRTMQLAHSVRELWSASFLFSRLMKHLTEACKTYGTLLSPDGQVKQPMHGAGVFPDRCYLQLEKDSDKAELESLKATALKSFSVETGIDIGLDYFQIYMAQIETDTYPIDKLNELLNVLELQQQFSPKVLLDFDKEYWNNPHKPTSKHFFQNLYQLAYNKEDILLNLKINRNAVVKRFPSIPEIATDELAKKSAEKYTAALGYQQIDTVKEQLYFGDVQESVYDVDTIIEKIKVAFPDDFKTRHKYFSIVQADGDNVGKLIAAIEKQKGNIGSFSQALNRFTEEAADILTLYGAFPVYIGGDDLLFFAPLANENLRDNQLYYPTVAHGNIFGNNLFFLLSVLNRKFRECLYPVTAAFNDLPLLSLSFGVMVGYYKHPMAEIQQDSYHLLFHNAKQQDSKNYIAMQVQKHSGQTFDVGFAQQGLLYEAFLQLSVAAGKKEDNFLNAFMYKLHDQQQVVDAIANRLLPDEKGNPPTEETKDQVEERLTYFFEENFNEAVHEQYHRNSDEDDLKDPFFKAARAFIMQTYLEYPAASLAEKMDKIYGALRFVHFLNAKDTDE